MTDAGAVGKRPDAGVPGQGLPALVIDVLGDLVRAPVGETGAVLARALARLGTHCGFDRAQVVEYLGSAPSGGQARHDVWWQGAEGGPTDGQDGAGVAWRARTVCDWAAPDAGMPAIDMADPRTLAALGTALAAARVVAWPSPTGATAPSEPDGGARPMGRDATAAVRPEAPAAYAPMAQSPKSGAPLSRAPVSEAGSGGSCPDSGRHGRGLAIAMRSEERLCGFVWFEAAPTSAPPDPIQADLLAAVADGVCAILQRRRSARRMAEARQALRDARNRLQATFDAIPDIVLELDGAGRFTGVHAADPGDLHLPPADFLGRCPEDVLPAEVARIARLAMAGVDASGRSGPHRYALDPPSDRLDRNRARRTGAGGNEAPGRAWTAPGPTIERAGNGGAGAAASGLPAAQPPAVRGGGDGAGAAPRIVGAAAAGRRWYTLTAARRHPDRPGAAPGYVFVVRNITAEVASSAEAERLSRIARGTNDMVILFDRNDRIDWVNPAFEARFGWRLDELRGRRPEEVLNAPEADPETIRRLRAAKLRGEKIRAEILNRSRHGETFWTEVQTHAMHDDDGTLVGAVSIETDITQRKAQEARLQALAREANEARTRLETAVEALPDGFAYYDSDDRLVICNERYREFNARTAPLIVPGARFEDLVRASVYRGDVAVPKGGEEAWIAARIAAHRDGRSGSEHLMADGRWLRVIERATPDGGRVGMRVDVTEQKEAERRLADIIHGAEAGTWEWHVPSGENRINARWAEIVGYTLDELAPHTIEVWSGLVHPDDGARADARLKRVFARELDQFEYELRMRHKDGHWVWVMSRGRVARWAEDGSPELMAGVHLDITALKQAEERLEAILDGAEAGTWETDPAKGGMRVNARWAEMFGYSLSEVIHQPECGFRVLLHPDDLTDLEAQYGADWSRRPDRFENELRFRHRDGHYVWVLSRGRILSRDAEGRPVRTAGIHIDITERKRLEAQLVAERDYLARLMETSVAGITALDADGRIIFANREAEAILGLPVAQIDGRRYADPAWSITALDGGPFPEERLPFERALAEGRTIRDVRFAIAWPDGTRRKLSVNAAPIRAEGSQARVVCSIVDITDQVAAEETLRQTAARAEAASEAKSRFLANMSHEIRTPLNGVLGMAEVLAEELTEPRHRRMLQIIRGSGEMLLGVLNDVLDMSKIEAGKLTLEAMPFVPADLLGRVEAMHALRAAEKQLTLEVVAGPGAADPRLGDPGRLEQLLHNLVGNAVKFTESGGVVVTLRSAPLSGSSSGPTSGPTSGPGTPPLELVVRDTGIGMSEDQLARVFEDFEQADGTVTRRFGGTGLGMSISRRLVALMGGEISIVSAPGQGTEVRVLLPLPCAAAMPLPEAAPSLSAPLAGLRVLAADDNATNRLILQTMLGRLGVVVTMVPDGRAAVEAWGPGRFDLILLDISMPELDGVGALAAIRAREAEAAVQPAPAVAITANAMAHQVADYFAAGFAAHVGKPFRREDLAVALAQLAVLCPGVDLRRGSADADRPADGPDDPTDIDVAAGLAAGPDLPPGDPSAGPACEAAAPVRPATPPFGSSPSAAGCAPDSTAQSLDTSSRPAPCGAPGAAPLPSGRTGAGAGAGSGDASGPPQDRDPSPRSAGPSRRPG
ncbi:MAG: PAS domain S-box protein [Alkalilacustris sp.]